MENRNKGLGRRKFLKALAALPVLGGLAAYGAPILRFLKPNLEPGLGLPKGQLQNLAEMDLPTGGALPLGSVQEFKEPWSFRYFVYTQAFAQYTPQRSKSATIPAMAIKLPNKLSFPGFQQGKVETDIVMFSRICPHLGCIFNFVPNHKEVTAGYGGYTPPPERQHGLMACPCHLSIYDPADAKVPGRVISGPAPREPRYMSYEIRDGILVVTGAEPGGIA
ncbi:MAG: Rieske 2Fe-2S domain-containing protein [Armatimonadetes bacterium]|nr:Rieske 2Fe-2S domain-containing protein [Armatimonadota bacterium]